MEGGGQVVVWSGVERAPGGRARKNKNNPKSNQSGSGSWSSGGVGSWNLELELGNVKAEKSLEYLLLALIIIINFFLLLFTPVPRFQQAFLIVFTKLDSNHPCSGIETNILNYVVT